MRSYSTSRCAFTLIIIILLASSSCYRFLIGHHLVLVSLCLTYGLSRACNIAIIVLKSFEFPCKFGVKLSLKDLKNLVEAPL